MSKPTLEETQGLIERLSPELHLIVTQTKACIKVESPATRHKMYLFKTAVVGRIDCTLDLPVEPPGQETLRLPLRAHNGKIMCHIVPSLEAIERALRMLADSGSGKLDVSRPRPFAATRTPKPVAEPVPTLALEPVADDGESLANRLARIKERGRAARIARRLENDTTGRMTREIAEALEDGRISEDDLEHTPSHATRDIAEALASGVEIES